jgi:hypothetical protein
MSAKEVNMVFCTECGTKHDNEAVFCENCGVKLEKPVIHRQEPKNKVKRQKVDRTSKLKLLKILGLVIILAVVLAFGRNWYLGLNDPGMKLMHGTVKTLQTKNPEMTVHISFDKTSKELEFLENLSIEIAGGIDKEELSGKAMVNYNKKDLAEGGISYQSGNMFVDLMDLYDELMYVDASEAEAMITSLIQLKDYLQALDIKGVNWKTYGKILTEEMGRSIEKDGSDVLLTLNVRDLYYTLDAMLNEAEEDEDLKEGLQEALVVMFEKMIKDDFEMDNMSTRDWEEGLEFINDQWDEAYEELLYGLREFVEYDLEDLEYSPLADQEIRFSFSFNKLTAIETHMDLEDMQMKIVVDLKDGYHAKSYKVKKAENIEDFDARDVEYMMKDVMENLVDNIKGNKDLVKDIESTSLFNMYASWYGIDSFDELMEVIFEDGFDTILNELMYIW